MSRAGRHIVLLSGGTGGARLARLLGRLARPGDRLSVIANVGDDFEHLGLYISPDLDAVIYHLADVQSRDVGWGIADETFRVLTELGELGGPSWFHIGDRDLATHLYRTWRMRAGAPLSTVAGDLASARGIGERVQVMPASDDPVRTVVRTEAGDMPFQEYLVERRARDTVKGFHYAGAASAQPAPGVLAAIADADLVVFGPSNPYVSLLPILAVPGIRAAIARSGAPAIALSPIVGGQAIKGPLSAMLQAFGQPVTGLHAVQALDVAIRVLVVDPADRELVPDIARQGITPHVAPIVFSNPDAMETVRSLWEWDWSPQAK